MKHKFWGLIKLMKPGCSDCGSSLDSNNSYFNNRYQEGLYMNTTPNTSGEVNISLRNCPRGATYKSIFPLEFARIAGLSNITWFNLQFSTANTVVKYRDELAVAIEEAVSKVSIGPDTHQPAHFSKKGKRGKKGRCSDQ
ncbi:hypothetical protein AX15_003086 [Amanita polypyramis BW_CC]|nr:hypothetical protein AX15_003086 [Amanita polypyramis BW_CC]